MLKDSPQGDNGDNGHKRHAYINSFIVPGEEIVKFDVSKDQNLQRSREKRGWQGEKSHLLKKIGKTEVLFYVR